jgi:hypothetical protein
MDNFHTISPKSASALCDHNPQLLNVDERPLKIREIAGIQHLHARIMFTVERSYGIAL